MSSCSCPLKSATVVQCLSYVPFVVTLLASACVCCCRHDEIPTPIADNMAVDSIVFLPPLRPGKRVLDGVSFTADAGQVLALVGPSGGGKSSCIALLENLYQPSRGQVILVYDAAPTLNETHISEESGRFEFHALRT